MAVWAHWLVDAARLAVQGTGKSVIVQPGWESRGHGGLRLIEFVIGHHTATPESAPGDYPSLGVVTNGREGLAGPLAQLGLGRSGNVYVIAAGLAYHAGASYYAGYYDLNDESLGIEAEDSGDGKWTDDQLFMYPRLVGALLHYLGRHSGHYASHRTVATPAGRKPDPAGISDDWMRQQSDAARQGGFTVALTSDDITSIVEAMKYRVLAANDWRFACKDGGQRNVMDLLVQTMNTSLDISTASAESLKILRAGSIDVEALAAALAPLLGPMIEGGASTEEVEAACTTAVRKVFADAGSPES